MTVPTRTIGYPAPCMDQAILVPSSAVKNRTRGRSTACSLRTVALLRRWKRAAEWPRARSGTSVEPFRTGRDEDGAQTQGQVNAGDTAGHLPVAELTNGSGRTRSRVVSYTA